MWSWYSILPRANINRHNHKSPMASRMVNITQIKRSSIHISLQMLTVSTVLSSTVGNRSSIHIM